MKLNYKRTCYIGLAFFLITLFWQTYDALVPKMLTDKFGMSQLGSGIIMAIDNVLALFLLPLFGTLSDKTKTRLGRRTPYILIGTVIAAIAILGFSFVDGAQLQKLDKIAAVTDSASPEYSQAMENLYESDVEISVGEERGTLKSLVDKEEFLALDMEDENYTKYVVPARQAYAAAVTSDDSSLLIIFIAILMVALLAMATFRSPAVALMPDATPKPLRSKANAIINLMGTAGGIIILISGMVFGTGNAKNALMDYFPAFALTTGLMLIALIIFKLKVNEPKFVLEMEAASAELEGDEESESGESKKGMSRAELVSMMFILSSVVFWFMGYNAVTSKYSVYASNVLQLDFNLTLIIAQAAAVVAYIPAGMLATKIGRKKTILIGITFLAASFFFASFMRAGTNIWIANLLFIMAGIGWATINVNSYPMVVELARGSTVGKYTGYYYTASMAAQTVTPILSGKLFDAISMEVMFPYATIFVVLSFVTMLFVKHGDSKKIASSSKLEMLDVD